MKPESADEVLRSPPERWVGRTFIVFAVLLGLVYFLSRQGAPTTNGAQSGSIILPASPETTAWLSLLAAEDPAWLVMPHARGFSAAWLTNTSSPHQLYRWEPPEQWLEFNASSVGQVLAEYVHTNRIKLPTVWERPAPEFAALTAAPILLRTLSEWETTGALGDRSLMEVLRLQSWTNVDFLRPSIVQLAVNAEGWARETRLLHSSGLVAADQEALRQAQVLRFRPLPNSAVSNGTADGLDVGTIVFRWHTLADTVTNAVEHPLPFRVVVPR